MHITHVLFLFLICILNSEIMEDLPGRTQPEESFIETDVFDYKKSAF